MKRFIMVAIVASLWLVPTLALAADTEYRSTIYGFSFTFPEGEKWAVAGQPAESHLDLIFRNATGQEMELKRFNNEPRSFDEMTQAVTDEFINGYLPDYTTDMRMDAPDFTITSWQWEQIDGRKALYILGKAHYKEGVETIVEHFMVLGNGKMTTITFRDLTGKSAIAKESFERIAASFHTL